MTDEEKWQKICDAIDGLTAALNQLRAQLEPIICQYKLQQEMYALRWKVTHADLVRQLDELEKFGK